MLFRLFCSFFKIGAFTFGGGWAMIALIEKEVVDVHRWMSREEFYDCLSVAQALPGVIAVNIAVAVGLKIRGLRGAVCAASGAVLPSFLMILAIAIFLNPSVIKENHTLAAIFKGIRPCVVALIIAPVFNAAKAGKVTWKTAFIPVGVALLIWSKFPLVSNPILFIVLAIAVGYWLQNRQIRQGRADKKE